MKMGNIVLLTNLSNVCDYLSHKRFIAEIHVYGINMPSLIFDYSYSTNRKQTATVTITVTNTYSSQKYFSVCHGSIQSPFTCYLRSFSNRDVAIFFLTVTLMTLLVSKLNKSLSVAAKNCLGSKLIRCFILKHMSHRCEKNSQKTEGYIFLKF